MRALVVIALLVGAAWPAALNAQSLGAIAEREAERRKHVRQGKRYTNEELLPVPAPSTGDAARTTAASATEGAEAAKPSPDSAPSDSSGTAASAAAEPPKPPKPPVNEAEWRAQARERRQRIQKFRSDIAVLESRLAEAERNADVSPEARSERQVYIAPLEELRRDLQKWLAEFERFEQRAREAHVPAEWIQ